MSFEVTKTDVWAGRIEDHPGALADKLENVMRAGANLDFIIVRPTDDGSEAGVVFMAPIFGNEQVAAAAEVGLDKTNIHTLRLIGPDRPGLAAGIARKLAEAGLNITGLSSAAIEDKCLFYVRFGSEDDLRAAAQILTSKLA